MEQWNMIPLFLKNSEGISGINGYSQKNIGILTNYEYIVIVSQCIEYYNLLLKELHVPSTENKEIQQAPFL